MAREALPGRVAALERPNLVLIICDTLRADYTTPYGFDEVAHPTSPELAAWAGRGVVFERVRSQSSWTKMSMASMLTSLWPRSHGITEAQDGLSDEATTLAEALQQGGYATYGVQTNGWLHQSFGFQQGFDRYAFPMGGGDRRFGGPSLWAHADRVVEEAERLLDAHYREREGEPFFLYLHFMDVHEYAAPPEFKHYGEDARGAYLASIRWVDDALRRVREKLADTGDLERTLLVFGADHGETFGEHDVHGHARNVLTPVIWVPLVVRWPFAADPVRVATHVRNVDVAPTLLELAGLAVPEGFEGESLLPLVAAAAGATDEDEDEDEDEAPADRPAYAALGLPLFLDASVQSAVTDGTWTFARNAPVPEDGEGKGYEAKARAPGAEYLFDRRVDPGENVNLLEIETEQAELLRAALDAHAAGGSRALVDEGVRIDPSIAERLRAMGYLQ